MKQFNIGDRVTCDYRGDWQGVVIAINDPRIWTDTLAFRGVPTQEQVDKHIEWCLKEGLVFDDTPIEWEFGKFYWEQTDNLHKV